MTDNFKPIQIGGEFIDFDNLHGTVDNTEFTTIDYSHEKIHEGRVFHAGYFAGTVADGGTALLTIAAGTISPHIVWLISAGGNAKAIFTEGGTISGGTAVTVFNKDRNNTGSCLTTCLHSGTLTGGTAYYNVMVPGGVGPKPPSGALRDDSEWMAMKNKSTTMQVINISGAAGPYSIGVDFYEENEE